MDKELIKQKLITWCKKHKYDQGDEYYAGMTTGENGYKWYVRYVNDYPMQHGSGKKFILTPEEFNQAISE